MSDDYKITMIVGQGCPACGKAKKGLSSFIDSGRIKVMDVVKDDEAMKLAEKFNITGVPHFILGDKSNQFIEACELKADLSGVICKEKEVKF